jgi:hypothetical protein
VKKGNAKLIYTVTLGLHEGRSPLPLPEVWGVGVTDFPRAIYLHPCESKAQYTNKKI